MKEAKEDLQRLRSSVGLQKEALQRQKDALDKSRVTSRRLELVTLKQMADFEAQISALQQPWTGHAGEAICVADMRCSRYIDAGDKSLAASSSVAACRSYCNRTYPAVPYFAFHNARGMVRMALAVPEPGPSSGPAWQLWAARHSHTGRGRPPRVPHRCLSCSRQPPLDPSRLPLVQEQGMTLFSHHPKGRCRYSNPEQQKSPRHATPPCPPHVTCRPPERGCRRPHRHGRRRRRRRHASPAAPSQQSRFPRGGSGGGSGGSGGGSRVGGGGSGGSGNTSSGNATASKRASKPPAPASSRSSSTGGDVQVVVR